MKIIREPKVYLAGYPMLCQEGWQEFLRDEQIDWQPEGARSWGEALCEIAGRLCYLSFSKPRPGGNKAYLRHILEVGHGSVIEHAVWSFLITRISRSCSHELVRHRAGISCSQLSQRYVDESIAEYVEPDIIANDSILHERWCKAVGSIHEHYRILAETLLVCSKLPCSQCGYNEPVLEKLAGAKVGCPRCKQVFLISTEDRKVAHQAARSVLPNATETKIFVTANARALRNFIELRASRHAEPEIRKVASKIWELLVREAPNLFADYQKAELPDGSYELVTEHKKV